MTHVDEIVLEDAVRFGLLDAPGFRGVRKHVFECTLCRERLAEMNEYAGFLHTVPEEETTGSLTSRHDTGRETVFLVVTGSDAVGWQARAVGGGRYTTRTFAKGPDAKAWLDGWYSRTFG